jgi:uncharacterized SAM-binding protein YcdF (DUF218 family)
LFKGTLYTLLTLLGLGVALFLSAGYFVDAVQAPKKSDLIVSLGGGDGRRIKEALRLYKLGYSGSQKLLYTGRAIVNPARKLPYRFSKDHFLKSHGLDQKQIVYVPRGVITNTAEELFFVRDYMLKHHYKSVLIVSSPIHTRRIRMLARYLADYRGKGLKLTVTAFKDPNWHPKSYFLTPYWRREVWLEIEKLVYNLLKYSPLTIDKTAYAKKREEPIWLERLKKLP